MPSTVVLKNITFKACSESVRHMLGALDHVEAGLDDHQAKFPGGWYNRACELSANNWLVCDARCVCL